MRAKYEASLDEELLHWKLDQQKDFYLIRQFFVELNESMTIRNAARATGVSQERVRAWRREIPGVDELVEEHLKVLRVESLEETLYQRAKDPDNPTGAAAAMFLLKGQKRDTYGDKIEQDIRVTHHVDLANIRDIRSELTDRVKHIQALAAQTAKPLPAAEVVEASYVEVQP